MRMIFAFITTSLFAASASAQIPKVVTDITPITSLVTQVMGNLGAPVGLVSGKADAHHATLSPSQITAIEKADLVIWLGPQMSNYIGEAIVKTGAQDRQLALLNTQGTMTLERAETHDDHAHDHDEIDPHAWLDPDNARHWLGLIAESLSTADPKNAATYHQNAAQAQDEIAALDAEIAAALSPVLEKKFVTGHNAYRYFTTHYGLMQNAAISMTDARDPSAKRLSELRAQLAQENISCLFPEVGANSDYLNVLAEGTTLRIGAALDPEGMAQEPGPSAYARMLTALGSDIATCLKEAK